MVRQASKEYKDWRAAILASPWVREVTKDMRCDAPAGYVHKRNRGDLTKAEEFRCDKKAKFFLRAVVTKNMITVDAVTGNYCPRHMKQAIKDHDGERDRFQRYFAKYAEETGTDPFEATGGRRAQRDEHASPSE